MRVFLRSSTTGRYYGAGGRLDAEPGDALEFASVPVAARRACAAGLAGVHIVVRCDYLSQEVVMPMMPEWCDLDSSQSREAAAETREAVVAGC